MADDPKQPEATTNGNGAGEGNGQLPAPFRPENQAGVREEIRDRADTVFTGLSVSLR
jgi:hypothetical protein